MKKKTANILERANRRAKRSEILDPRVLIQHMWGTFDLLVFKVILSSFGALVSKWFITLKRMVVERN